MGMFDYIEVDRSLLPDLPRSFEPNFQTKSFEPSLLDHYRITEPGVLEHQEYRIEDRSDHTKTGLMRFAGALTRVDKHWEPVLTFTGEVRFYDEDDDTRIWYEYSAYFEHGHLVRGPNRITEDRAIG